MLRDAGLNRRGAYLFLITSRLLINLELPVKSRFLC